MHAKIKKSVFGVLAFQIPDSRKQPSHVEMEKIATTFSSLKHVRVPRNEVDMSEYYTLFQEILNFKARDNINLWMTTYVHALPPSTNNSHPVMDFLCMVPFYKRVGVPE